MRYLLIFLLIAVSFPAFGAAPTTQPQSLSGQRPIDLMPESRQLVTMPGDTRLIAFTYDPNETYTILGMPGAVTDVELRKDERVEALALGDGVQWQAQKKDNHLFLRPLREGLFSSATLVTNERTYQLMLRSSPAGGKWYQRVSWQYPDILVMEENRATAALASTRLASVEERPTRPAPLAAVPVDKLNFAYELKGDASFRPAEVFDDGRFTYIRFKEKPQEMPALFLKTPDGYALTVYTFEPDTPTLKVHRRFDAAVLKLGTEEVEIISTRNR